ncbi:MAG: hypothetical protein ABW190_07450 [Rhizobacter sp.]
MQESTKRSTRGRVIAVVGVVLASQLLTACVVVPVPHRHRAVVVQPGYSGPPPGYHRHPDRDWRR